MPTLTPDLVRHIVSAALASYPDPLLRGGFDPAVLSIGAADAAGLLVRFDDETVALLTITVAGPES